VRLTALPPQVFQLVIVLCSCTAKSVYRSAAVPAAVVGASRPHWRGQDALATAGETPALQVPAKKVLYAGRGPSTAQRLREATPLLRSG